MNKRSEYRPDIDGLRALAVGAVVIFHVFNAGLVGGYLGVDVFFVISGYLITRILVREFDEGSYSIVRFYERRVRRLMPALLAMILIVSGVSVLLLLPADLLNYARSVIATFAFVSNVFFWRTAGYFDSDAATKPLLHTWSLGVEEQFYIVFPLLLRALLFLKGRRVRLIILVALTLASYGIDMTALYLSKSFVAFYLLPMRAWELGIGAILAHAAKPIHPRFALLGLVLLIVALAAPNILPGTIPDATLACIGAGLLIWAGDASLGRALSAKAMTGVGLISYSLYLWHWPIFVFASYLAIRPLTFGEGCLVVLASFALAYLSWRHVESPFRRGVSLRRLLTVSGVGTLALALVAVAIMKFDGLPGRFQGNSAAFNQVDGTHYRCEVTDYMRFGPFYACPVNLPSHDANKADVVLMGNSHAQMYVPAVREALRQRGLQGLLVPVSGCSPFIHYNTSKDCIAVSRANLAAVVALRHARIVILSFAWHKTKLDMVDAAARKVGMLSWPQIQSELTATIATLRKSGKTVIVVGPIPVPGYYVASVVSREIAFRGVPKSPLEQSRPFFDRHMGVGVDWVRSAPLGTIPAIPSDVLCDREQCHYVLKNRPVYADDHHLSSLAMPLFVPMFATAIDSAINMPADKH